MFLFYKSKSSRKTEGSCYLCQCNCKHIEITFSTLSKCVHAFSWTKKIQQRLDLKKLEKTRLHISGSDWKICLYSWTRYFWMKGALLWIALDPLSVLNAKRNLAFFPPFTSFHSAKHIVTTSSSWWAIQRLVSNLLSWWKKSNQIDKVVVGNQLKFKAFIYDISFAASINMSYSFVLSDVALKRKLN